ncbi:hypothetical protein AURDEDRAFT_164331 [Auricularia subglabra TFB-10046 SS5]|nr:hypothetical protein AURDEDRAFT_164331 [Auricularia subglabra TFB-10046 SS5]
MLPLFSLFSLFLLAGRCMSRVFNVTIDDKFGDERTGLIPLYIPEDRWTNSGQGEAYKSTLHQRISDRPGNISITFNGIMIYTFFAYWPASQVNLIFYLDDATSPTKHFIHPPYTGSDPIYWAFNLMAFQSDKLDPGEHTLLVSSPGGPDTPLSFDYAIYTVEEPDPVPPDPDPSSQTTSTPLSTSGSTAGSSGNGPESPMSITPASATRDADTRTLDSSAHTPSSPVTPDAGAHPGLAAGARTAAIAGGVGGAMLLLLLILFVLCRRRRRRTGRHDAVESPGRSGDASVTPFPARRTNAVPAPVASDKKSHRSDDSISPFLASSEPSSRQYGKGGSSQATSTDRAMSEMGSRSEGTAYFRAELERVRAEKERALEEIAMLRQVAEPPPYSSPSTSGSVRTGG